MYFNQSAKNSKNPPCKIVKTFLIRGGTEKERHDKALQLYQDNNAHMYNEYNNKNELAVIFYEYNCSDKLAMMLYQFSDLEKMTFEQAKSLAGSLKLDSNFHTSSFGNEPSFGVIDITNSNSTSNSECTYYHLGL